VSGLLDLGVSAVAGCGVAAAVVRLLDGEVAYR